MNRKPETAERKAADVRVQYIVKRKVEQMTFDKPGMQRHMLLWHKAAKEAVNALEKGRGGKCCNRKDEWPISPNCGKPRERCTKCKR